MTRVDVEHQILGSQEIECPFCCRTRKLKEFGRFVMERAGLKIVHCTCLTCYRDWRRIETK